jgi:hypothetical protein
MNEENVTRTTAVPGPPTTGTVDNPMCTCCTPQQPLEPIEKTQYQCPVTGLKYTFDPAEGVPRRAESSAQGATTQREGIYPSAPPREEIRTVNPEDPFA